MAKLVLPGQEVSYNEPGRNFARHHHLGAYAALLIRGTCHETGDRGRRVAAPGDVFVHRAFDGHGDCIGPEGAAFINIPLDHSLDCAFGRVSDLDAVMRAFEESFADGAAQFHRMFESAPGEGNDWPDLLAAQLAQRNAGSLACWSDAHGLNPASVSRGFRVAYGISPKRFRLEQMAANAAREIRETRGPLSIIASEMGFADQAHMTRALVSVFGVAPGALRQLG